MTTKTGAQQNLDFAVVKSPTHASKFTFAQGSRNSAAGQSSYEYYEESEEETIGLRSPRVGNSPRSNGGIKQPDPASALINVENQRNQGAIRQKYELYLDAVRELYELLNMD